jgi:hflC protein
MKNTFDKKSFVVVACIVVVILCFIFLNPFYTVQENEAALITRLGKIHAVEREPGLHWRVPMLDDVQSISMKVLRIDGDTQKIPTRENQFIEVNTTTRWRITDVAQFYRSLRSYEAALSKIADITDASCRDIISVNSFDSIVRSSNIINKIDSQEELNLETDEIDTSSLFETQQKDYVNITKGREEIADDVKSRANAQLSVFGIEVIDVIFKGIKYADELQESVFKRMITERNKIASTIRSTGEGKKAEILGKLENEKQSILSGSYAKAEAIRGQADAEAAAIYAEAYNKDPAFYSFWKSLEAYKKTLPNIEKIMSTDSDFFNYLYRP